jgi:hypothetical protein
MLDMRRRKKDKHMNKLIGMVVSVGFLTACSATPVVINDEPDSSVKDSSVADSSMAQPDTSTTPDAGCPSGSGATACDDVLTAWCTRVVQCCMTGSTCNCAAASCDVNMCKGYNTANGYDCAASKYGSKMSCNAETSACVGDIPLISCSDVISSKANWPASCNVFWAQF